MIAPRPAPALLVRSAPQPLLEPEPRPAPELIEPLEFEEFRQSFLTAVREPVTHEAAGAEPPPDHPRAGTAFDRVFRHWNQLDVGKKVDLLIQLAMLALTIVSLLLTVILAVVA